MEKRRQLIQHREAEMLEELRRLDEELAKTYELDEDLRIIAEEVLGCHIRLVEEDKLVIRAGVGPHFEKWAHIRREVAVDDPLSICAKAISAAKPHIVTDTSRDPLWRQLRESTTDEEILYTLNQVTL